MVIKIFARLLLVGFLTVPTQLGGIAYFLAHLAGRGSGSKLKVFVLFVSFYSAFSVMAVFVAPTFGRVPLACFVSSEAKLAMKSPLLCVLNRQYVRPKLKAAAEKLANEVDRQFPGTVTLALDANFPFLDKFPLLPHLSHNDGRKMDIAYYYSAPNGRYLRGQTKSPVGYWGFERPNPESKLVCAGRNDLLSMRWDVQWFEPFLHNYGLDETRLRAALLWLAEKGEAAGIEKAFIEPHLAARLNVKSPIIRFQGCRAARHDDHLHIQVK